MVVDLAPPASSPAEIDRIFGALADATRRDILVRTLEQPQSVSALAQRYDMTFAGVQKHVAVLHRAGLVAKVRRGREQVVSGEVAAVQRATRLLEDLEAVWRARLDRFADELATAAGRPDPSDPSHPTDPGAPA